MAPQEIPTVPTPCHNDQPTFLLTTGEHYVFNIVLATGDTYGPVPLIVKGVTNLRLGSDNLETGMSLPVPPPPSPRQSPPPPTSGS